MENYEKIFQINPLIGTLSLLSFCPSGKIPYLEKGNSQNISYVRQREDIEKKENIEEEKYIETVPASISLEQLARDDYKKFPEGDDFKNKKTSFCMLLQMVIGANLVR